jgi:hypothetical protein
VKYWALLVVLFWWVGFSTQASVVLYQTTFDQGYNTQKDLDGQNGWLGTAIAEDGNTGLLNGSAYIGFDAPATGESGFFVWHPLQPVPNPNQIPVIHFFTRLVIVDSVDVDSRDWFGWTAVNQQENSLFTLVFNNDDLGIYYFLDNTSNAISTGFTFTNDATYELEIQMDFRRNQWSAIVSDVIVVTNAPITERGAALNLGDMDAEWSYSDSTAPGDNFMLFDDYRVVGIPIAAQPTLTFVERLSNGRAVVRLMGQAGSGYALEGSPDLVTWSELISSQAPANGVIEFTDATATAFQRRFYRARALP